MIDNYGKVYSCIVCWAREGTVSSLHKLMTTTLLSVVVVVGIIWPAECRTDHKRWSEDNKVKTIPSMGETLKTENDYQIQYMSKYIPTI